MKRFITISATLALAIACTKAPQAQGATPGNQLAGSTPAAAADKTAPAQPGTDATAVPTSGDAASASIAEATGQ